jgi:hypothetical protein
VAVVLGLAVGRSAADSQQGCVAKMGQSVCSNVLARDTCVLPPAAVAVCVCVLTREIHCAQVASSLM